MRGAGCVATGSVARTLVEFGWVRELNEGVQRIYDEMASFFLNDPVFSEPNDASVQLTLENSITSRVLRQHDAMVGDMGQEVYGSLNEYELAAIQVPSKIVRYRHPIRLRQGANNRKGAFRSPAAQRQDIQIGA